MKPYISLNIFKSPYIDPEDLATQAQERSMCAANGAAAMAKVDSFTGPRTLHKVGAFSIRVQGL